MKRKGIILAAGEGTRLYPATKTISKHLLPVFDKPMVYYPLSTLLQAGLDEILVISRPQDMAQYKQLLGDGSQWGIKLQHLEQPSSDGIAQALILAEKFLDGSPSVLILGDNIFYGDSFDSKLTNAMNSDHGATVFAYHVNNPERYGVIEFNADNQVVSLEEKPITPRSNYAVTGLYFYDTKASEYAKRLTPSPRGELEITDLNKIYLDLGQLSVERISRGHTWLDTGTHESLLEADQFVQTIEHRQGLKIACPEEIAFRKGKITLDQLENLARPMLRNGYGEYLMSIVEGNR